PRRRQAGHRIGAASRLPGVAGGSHRGGRHLRVHQPARRPQLPGTRSAGALLMSASSSGGGLGSAAVVSVGGVARGRTPPLLKILRRPTVAFGAGVFVIVLLLALLAPVITPSGPNDLAILDRLQPPSAEHWMVQVDH